MRPGRVIALVAAAVGLAALGFAAPALSAPPRGASPSSPVPVVVLCADFPFGPRLFRAGPEGGLAGWLTRRGWRVVEADPWGEAAARSLEMVEVLSGPYEGVMAEARAAAPSGSITWIGHGVCGLLPLVAAAAGRPTPDLLVTLGTPFDFRMPAPALRRWLEDPQDRDAREALWRPGIGVQERIPLGDGPPSAWIVKALRQAWLSGRGLDVDGVKAVPDGLDAWRGPLLAVAGAIDPIAPPEDVLPGLSGAGPRERSWRVVGWADKARGDYGHLGLLLGDHAVRDVFKPVEAWMKERLSRDGGRR